MEQYKCSFCDSNYSTLSSLRRHNTKFHPGNLIPLQHNRSQNENSLPCFIREQHKCSLCDGNYSTLSSLRRHNTKFHPGNVIPFRHNRSHDENSLRCSECEKSFRWKQALQHHMKTHHKGNATLTSNLSENATTKNRKKCPLCSQCYNFTSDMLEHFKDIHEVPIHCEQFTFASFEAFNQWKSIMENVTTSRFFKNKSKTSKNHTRIMYVCHRSGNYFPTGKGIRHLKTQGSNKINAFCPSNIKIFLKNDGSVETEFLETHIGHENQLRHLQLSTSERHDIAAKIASKIPFDVILDQVRDSMTDNTLKRIHLLTRKDLFNIETSFNLSDSAVRHPNDAINVSSWVTEMQRNSDCILFYKQQGSLMESHPMLKEEDFVLVIMTPAQCALLNEHGSDVVCLDGTHGINNYDFELTTLLVIDKIREGFPCAFMVSNRSDKDVMKVFFSWIRTKTGILKPKTFMSDLADSYFNAWVEVMSVPQMRLFCTWHTDRAWRKNLVKIASKEKQVMVYKELRTLLEERDATAFKIMLEKFCGRSDSETSDFIRYFKENYQNNYESWAYCCRLNAGINTNMYLESLHKTIKYIYLKGKTVKRLDKGIAALMRFVRDKLINQLVTNKGKISSKLRDIRARHKNMEKLDASLISATENGWEVPSSRSDELYIIQAVNDSCTCQLRCSDCNICIHTYCCTCVDSTIKFNVCKHIHLLAQFRKKVENLTSSRSIVDGDGEGTSQMTNELHIHVSHNADDASEAILSELSKKRETKMSLEQRKQKIQMRIQKHLDSAETESQVEVIERVVALLSPTVAAADSIKTSFASIEKLSWNKNINQQRLSSSSVALQPLVGPGLLKYPPPLVSISSFQKPKNKKY